MKDSESNPVTKLFVAVGESGTAMISNSPLSDNSHNLNFNLKFSNDRHCANTSTTLITDWRLQFGDFNSVIPNERLR